MMNQEWTDFDAIDTWIPCKRTALIKVEKSKNPMSCIDQIVCRKIKTVKQNRISYQ
jgi:hypothetical protein